jgi:LDH2 family malate/lactate/ureidoglycolate dehydrogenase
MEADRRAHGIPLEEGNWQMLCQAAARVNVEPPQL